MDIEKEDEVTVQEIIDREIDWNYKQYLRADRRGNKILKIMHGHTTMVLCRLSEMERHATIYFEIYNDKDTL